MTTMLLPFDATSDLKFRAACAQPTLLGSKANGALFDASGQYRYRLWRIWKERAPRVLFVMLNPSTADESKNDPTVRRCIGFANDWGFGSVEVVNIFAYRSTDPKVLPGLSDPVGPDNDKHIVQAIAGAERIVCAWGQHGVIRGRGDEVVKLLRKHGKTPLAFRITKNGQPEHPLYQKSEAMPVPFEQAKAR